VPPFAPVSSVIRIPGCAQDCGRLHLDATRGGPINQRPTSSNVIARKGVRYSDFPQQPGWKGGTGGRGGGASTESILSLQISISQRHRSCSGIRTPRAPVLVVRPNSGTCGDVGTSLA
ncbi:hypothetical protein QR685DRAFT_447758, partial [Neurospora intermedia]